MRAVGTQFVTSLRDFLGGESRYFFYRYKVPNGTKEKCKSLTINHSPFPILHSPFCIPHSAFCILHCSLFIVHCSLFIYSPVNVSSTITPLTCTFFSVIVVLSPLFSTVSTVYIRLSFLAIYITTDEKRSLISFFLGVRTTL